MYFFDFDMLKHMEPNNCSNKVGLRQANLIILFFKNVNILFTFRIIVLSLTIQL
jgi:hypothetical protein